MIPGDRCVPWLSVLPKAWQPRPLKYAVQFNPEVLSEDTNPDELIRYIDISAVNPEGEIEHIEELRFSASPSRARRLVRHGDVIVSTVRTYLTAIATIRQDGLTVSTGFAVLRPGHVTDPRFLAYWMRSKNMIEEIVARSTGVSYPAINPSEIGQLPIPRVNVDDQRMIADFLDRETAAIDTLIAKKTRFIVLLNENRQALITHAVTKGLDPNAKMKDSGEKWLEEIPAQWDVVPSNRFFPESKERAHEEDEHLSATQKYGVIPLAEFERLEGRQVTHAEKNLEQRKHVEVDDFVISMRSFEGGIERVKARGCVRSSYVALVADERAHVGFFSYLFKSSAYIQGLQATAMFIRDGQDLSYNNFRQVKLPFPSFEEQGKIAEFLDFEISKGNTIVAKTEGAISKLIEYRSALISAAVTGQIDVRNYRPQEAAALCQ
jgi:type I restriction enzyme S subunit